MKRLLLGLAVLFALGAGAAAAERPNVLFIMTDQQFAEAMSCRMGRQHIRTPAMDGLAAQGMLFTRAYTSNPLCMPARAALFSGRYPHEVGVTKNAGVKVDAAEFACLGNYFRRAGYETAYFGKWHLCYPPKDADSHGFETLQIGRERNTDHDGRAAAGAVEFLGREHARPFLLVVSLLNPHDICQYSRGQELPCGPIPEAPPAAHCPPVPANLAPPEQEPGTMRVMREAYHASPLFPVGHFTPDDWRRQRWGYYRLIEKVDAEIGRVLEALRRAGLEEKTLVVFTSDHGECAGAHGFNQKTVFYEESVRVPLVVSFKGRTAAAQCEKLVNTGIDLLPTMLDVAGIEIPKRLPGRSLAPLALGRGVAGWRDHVVSENNMCQTGPVGSLTPQTEGRMVRSDRYKYCLFQYGDGRESLVDLAADPGETKDLARNPEYRPALLEHRELLRRFAREHADPLVAEMLANDAAPRPFPPTATPPPKGKRR